MLGSSRYVQYSGSGGGSAVNIPGTVTTSAGAIANGASKSWSVNATAAGNYKFSIASSSIQVYFNGVSAGSKTLTITANSGSVAIGQISAATY